jgi:hypothetical protein
MLIGSRHDLVGFEADAGDGKQGAKSAPPAWRRRDRPRAVHVERHRGCGKRAASINPSSAMFTTPARSE